MTKVTDIALCSIVVYELRHGAESSSNPPREHAKLDMFVAPFSSLPFDDASAVRCAEIRRALERRGEPIGPHDLQPLVSAAPTRSAAITTAMVRMVVGTSAWQFAEIGILVNHRG